MSGKWFETRRASTFALELRPRRTARTWRVVRLWQMQTKGGVYGRHYSESPDLIQPQALCLVNLVHSGRGVCTIKSWYFPRQTGRQYRC